MMDNKIKTIVNPNETEVTKKILIHELGHLVIAKHLGYQDLVLFFNPYANEGKGEFNLSHSKFPKDISKTEIESLEDQIIIALGGKVAEELCGFQTGGFLGGDLTIIFKNLERKCSLEGRSFQFKLYGDLFKDYNKIAPYEEKAKIILDKNGGAEMLKKTAIYILGEYLEPNL